MSPQPDPTGPVGPAPSTPAPSSPAPAPSSSPSTPSFPASAAPSAPTLAALDAAVSGCRACPRLVAWREQVAQIGRRAFAGQRYWARPVPGFGPQGAPFLLVGLAPAAHGGNRTGRAFTGDPSGDVLFAALHDLGLASRPDSTERGDGMRLHGVRITMPVHCAPPENKPTNQERDTCRPWLERELELARGELRVVVALGAFAWQAVLPVLQAAGWQPPRPRPMFGHGARALLTDDRDPRHNRTVTLLGCYHPSRRNISTRTVTPAMLRDVLGQAAALAGLHPSPAPPPPLAAAPAPPAGRPPRVPPIPPR